MKNLKLPKFNGQALKLTALVLALWSAFTIANYFVVEFTGTGIEIIGNHNRVNVHAEAPGYCPDGWQDTSSKDEHQKVQSCFKDGWLVILKPDGSFDYGWREGSPAFELDPGAVPGW